MLQPLRWLLPLVFWVMMLGPATATQSPDAPPPRKVMVLLSEEQLAPLHAEWMRGIRSAIKTASSPSMPIEFEFFRVPRLDDPAYRKEWEEMAAARIRMNQPDLVIAVLDPAAEFALQKHDTWFHGVPLVLCSVSESLGERWAEKDNIWAIYYRLDIDLTVEAALHLRPQTKELVLLTGNMPEEKAVEAMVRRSLAGKKNVAVRFLSGLSYEAMVQAVRALPSDSVVLLGCGFWDRDDSENVSWWWDIKSLCAESSAPVFGLITRHMGRGILGGCLASSEKQGKWAGEKTVRILRGETASRKPLAATATNQFVFDWRQMQRWGIRESDLPPGSTIQFREPSLWVSNRSYLLLGAAVIAVQTILIVALIVSGAARVLANRALRASREEARLLSGRLLTAQEDERRHLAREMHDDLSQRLAVSAVQAGKIEQQAADSPLARQALTQLRESLVGLSEDVHRLSRQLHPAILEDLGLADALRTECEAFARREKIAVDFQCHDLPSTLPKDAGICCYRIAQESLRNIVKHSGTSRALVNLASDDELLYLEVRDFGRGFEPEKTQSRPGIGLASMEERVRLVGGQLMVLSRPGRGTTVSVRIPLMESRS